MKHDPSWVEYARVQREADTHIVSDQTWAKEEALSAILDRMERAEKTSRRRVENLISNRAAKIRHRRRLLRENVVLFPAAVNDNGRIEARIDLSRYRPQCSHREWRVLVLVGRGYTLHDIAAREGVPEATVKTWVRRLRRRLLSDDA